MKKFIVILAITLLPTAAMAWDNRYKDLYHDERTAQELQGIRSELRYQQEYKEYRDNLKEYNDSFKGREFMKPFSDHYFLGPRPPQR